MDRERAYEIVHVGAVRPGAYDPRDSKAEFCNWSLDDFYFYVMVKQLNLFVNDFIIGIPSLL